MTTKYPLTAIRAFEAAARTGSFAGAADDLFVTRPAISKQIRLLEEELGCALFERAHGTTTLTGPGEELREGVTQAFDRIAETMDRVRVRASGRDSLRILVEHDFASSWLAGSIGSFLVANPGISVEVLAERNGVMHLDQDYDFRIFYVETEADVAPEGFKVRELCNWIDLPLCAPEYFRSLGGEPEHHLENIQLLHDRSTQAWRNWLDIAGLNNNVDVEKGTIFNETSLCLSAAIAGAGVAIGDSFLAFESLKQGTLMPPFSCGLRKDTAYVLYRREGGPGSEAESIFEEWIVKALSDYMDEVENLLTRMSVQIKP